MRVAIAIAPEVRELLRGDPSQLSGLLREIHDEDLADLLMQLDEEDGIVLLEQLSVQNAADIFERLDEHDQTAFLERFGTHRLAPIVTEMEPDEATDLLESLPDGKAEKLLEEIGEIDPEAAADVEELLQWPEDSAGGLMTTEYVSVSDNLTVKQTVEHIRREAKDTETIYYIYCVSEGERLTGVVSLRDLILSDESAVLNQLMTTNLIQVAPELDQEDVAKTLQRYDVTALPVANESGVLLGVITVDDVIDVIAEERDEDLQKLAAVGPIEERYFQTSFWTFIKKRGPWLAILFFGEFIAGAVMQHYDPVLKAVSQLSHYIPLLISAGGNSGSQSSTLIIRGLATGDIQPGDWWRVLSREFGQGLLLGSGLALVGMARVMMVTNIPEMAATVGITVVGIVVMGCTVGGMLPLLLRRIGWDPATSSTPFVATLVDVLGILLYFIVAKLILANMLSGIG